MREIKFRAWDREEKIMIDLDNLHFGDSGAGTLTAWVKQGSVDRHLVFGENADLLEFTGLKDKNGKKIFEGDILTGRGNPILVEYSSPEFIFKYRNKENQSPFSWLVCGWGDLFEPEIIGNKFQHPYFFEKK